MFSIIEYFNENNINYTASGGSINGGNGYYDAFDKNDRYFCSTVTPYWQVNFDRLVSIASYTITAKSWNTWYMTSWKVSYSLDGSSFTNIQTESISSLNGNTNKFPLNNQVTCKSFRITGVKCSDNSDDLLFNSFDCYSPVALSKSKKHCSCNCFYYKRRLITNFLLALFPSFIT